MTGTDRPTGPSEPAAQPAAAPNRKLSYKDQRELDQLPARIESLEAELGESESTKLVWKPTTTTELDLEDMQKLMKLVEALEDDDDVQRVTTNFEATDDVMAQLEAG